MRRRLTTTNILATFFAILSCKVAILFVFTMTDHKALKKGFIEVYDKYADAIYRHLVLRVFSRARQKNLPRIPF